MCHEQTWIDTQVGAQFKPQGTEMPGGWGACRESKHTNQKAKCWAS